MFDQQVYNQIFQAIHIFLNNNMNRYGKQFAEGIMFDYDPTRSPQSQQNAVNLFNYVASQAQQMNNGQSNLSDQQLFQIIGNFVEQVFGRYMNQVQQNRGGFNTGGGFSQQSSFGGGFGSGMPRQPGQFGGFGQGQRASAGSHLTDDVVDNRPQAYQAPPQAAPQAAAPSSAFSFTPTAAPKETVSMTTFSDNPLDELANKATDFAQTKEKALWGDEKLKDNRIVLGRRYDLKTRDNKFVIGKFEAYHQLILSDPMDVVRDFFDVVPNGTLGSSFITKIYYHHLDVVDVPTRDFVEIREKCIDAVKQGEQFVLHKTIATVLDTMQRGPWKAMTEYLVKHVNRALHLACRLSNNPSIYIKIGGFEDIDELLSSSFRHDFTIYPDGRHQLEKIVGAALWNALVMNSNAMFVGEEDFPTNAVQSSPAFPFSMEGVYPNKFSIPIQNDEGMVAFRERLEKYELSKRTYILSKRSVVITNILGRTVLPSLSKTPQTFATAMASILNELVIPFNRLNAEERDVMGPAKITLPEGHPSEQLEEYYENSSGYDLAVADKYSRVAPTLLPVDQNIFAIQYGMDPQKYMTSVDVFSTIDGKTERNQTILATGVVSDITVTA